MDSIRNLINFLRIFFVVYFAGVINRGDSFRRKRSRSNSLANSPMSPNPSPSMPSRSSVPVESHRVSMLGGPGVGKTALITQFCTSECINAYEDTGLCRTLSMYCSKQPNECRKLFFFSFSESTVEQNVTVILNNIESELKFTIGQKGTKVRTEIKKSESSKNPFGKSYLLLFYCIRSFMKIKQEQKKDLSSIFHSTNILCLLYFAVVHGICST